MTVAIIGKSYMKITSENLYENYKSLSYRFIQMVNGKCDIGGSNVFIGICDRQLPIISDINISKNFSVGNSASWEKIWNTLGIPAPGKLPLGSRAIFMFKGGYDTTEHGAVGVKKIERVFGAIGSQIDICFRTTAEKNVSGGPSYGGFAVVIVPKTMDGYTYSTDGNGPSTVVTDYLAKGGTSPASQKKPPQP
jgi:hypothetical protein